MTDLEEQTRPHEGAVPSTLRIGEREYPVVPRLSVSEREHALRQERNEVSMTPRTTSEGFHILGTNDDETIRSLETLDGIPISEIEAAMHERSKRDVASVTGMLGKNEGLLQRLLADNGLVRSLKRPDGTALTHRDLYGAVTEIRAAITTHAPEGQGIQFVYERGNQKLLIKRSAGQPGSQYSPFETESEGRQRKEHANDEFHIINLTSGAHVRVPGIAPYFIARGFYEGMVPYRFDPKTLARAVGEIAESGDDPVSAFMRKEREVCEITTLDQLRRFMNLAGQGAVTLSKDNWHIRCTDSATYAEAMYLLSEEMITPEQFIKNVEITTSEAGDLVVGRYRDSEDAVSERIVVSLRKLSEQDPSLVAGLLDNISQVRLSEDKEEFAQHMIRFVVDDAIRITSSLDPLLGRTVQTRIRDAAKLLRGKRQETTDEVIRARFRQARGVYARFLGKVEDKEEMQNALSEIKRATLVTQPEGKQRKDLESFFLELESKFTK